MKKVPNTKYKDRISHTVFCLDCCYKLLLSFANLHKKNEQHANFIFFRQSCIWSNIRIFCRKSKKARKKFAL